MTVALAKPKMPRIHNSIAKDDSHDHHNHQHGYAIRAHGTILFLIFSIFIPWAVFLIRTRATKSFVHWVFQLTTAIASMGAMLIMLIRSWEAIKVIIPSSSVF